MKRILLVEPYYQNKYPPLGLMKIATYHRQRGDVVEFFKGEAPYTKISHFDRVYLTTLFTFHYDITINCIKHYQKFVNNDNIYIGGIASSLLPSDFEKDTGIHNIIRGQLDNSSILGYDDNINIDSLPLDYDILDDISYIYPAGDNYFSYTTRGCKRGCDFCAVTKLEKKFITTNNLIDQITYIDNIYGQKRNLLLLDNNILYSKKLKNIINDIKFLGFNGQANYTPPNPFLIMMNKVRRRIKYKVNNMKQIEDIIFYLHKFENRIERFKKAHELYLEMLEDITPNNNVWSILETREKDIIDLVEKYRSKSKLIRYVDFNQGIDARLIDENNIKYLSSISINPFRLAYDSIKETKIFGTAMKLAIDNNIKEFSNYMLFNCDEKPEELWQRLSNAVKIYTKSKKKIKGFSFPMKYAPITKKDRSYIGKYWNKKYLSAISIILNVTKGVVVQEEDFFQKAFGKDISEYLLILTMPDEFIRFRKFFKTNGLIDHWKNLYSTLTNSEKKLLLKLLSEEKNEIAFNNESYSQSMKSILELYKINKSQFDRGSKNVAMFLSVKQVRQLKKIVT